MSLHNFCESTVKEQEELCKLMLELCTKAYQQGLQDFTAKEEEYQRGLIDAWECAKKIYHMTAKEVIAIFGGCSYWVNYSASEAIEKIEKYEQGQNINITALKAVCEDLSDARGSDFSGVIALENAIKVLEQMKGEQND